mmetsp:Transcript_30357/g.58349  ORF Transcript_30357/g.58349 Transcript_30357/m.58349 type:complete len:305 (+) Transcript_30357:864-1778(+)
MLPTATAVSTSCQLAGIGGAALFSPIFLLGFPLLGPEYPLESSSAAIAAALLTEVFGFASGLTGYARRGLVAWSISAQFSAVSVPFAFGGALCAHYIADDPTLLRGVYASLMIGLSAYLTLSPRPDELEALSEEECNVEDLLDSTSNASGVEVCTLTTSKNITYTYRTPARGSVTSIGATGSGSFLTGLLGVGVGEVLLPQLVRGCCMSLPLAAGTSVATVVLTAAAAAVVQFTALASSEGSNVISVVPWDLVQFTIPGVLIGGQIAPFLASRGAFSDEDIERFASVLFGLVGCAFAIKAVQGG